MLVNCVKCDQTIEVPDGSPKPVLHHTWYICDACAHPQVLPGYVEPTAAVVVCSDLKTIIKNQALEGFTFHLEAAPGVPKTGAVVAATYSLDGKPFVPCAHPVVEIANGDYKIDLEAAELDGNIVRLKFIAPGALNLLLEFNTVPPPPVVVTLVSAPKAKPLWPARSATPVNIEPAPVVEPAKKTE